MNPLLLGLGKNTSLLRTRAQVLATRYDVVSVQDLESMKALPIGSAFRVLVLCHSLSREERREAVALARSRWPGIKTLLVTKPTSMDEDFDADRVVGSLEGPRHLLGAVQMLLARSSTRETGFDTACR